MLPEGTEVFILGSERGGWTGVVVGFSASLEITEEVTSAVLPLKRSTTSLVSITPGGQRQRNLVLLKESKVV